MSKDASEKAKENELKKVPAPTGTKKNILQELDRIGNESTPADPAKKAEAFAEIEALRNNYGAAAVDNLIIELGATNGIVTGDVLGAYIKAGVSAGPGSALTKKIATRSGELGAYDSAETKAAKAAVTLNDADKLKKNEDVVPPVDQTKDIGKAGESFVNLTSQTHQCILQHYMDDIAKYHRIKLGRGAAVAGGTAFLARTIAPASPDDEDAKIILIDDSDPESSVAPINALTSLGKTTGLSKLLPAHLATAMPSVRLYKIYRQKGEETGKIEFIFPTVIDRRFLTSQTAGEYSNFTMSPGYAKGRDAGIKSFDWSFIGGDPFTATRDLTAKLTIFFQDFRDLTLLRDGENLLSKKKSKSDRMEEYKYLDLIVQPDCRKGATVPASTGAPVPNTQNSLQVFNPDCYEIAVEVGYAQTAGMPKALKDRNDTLYLTMVEHSFDIGQDGTFSLSIDYRARLASLLGDKGTNVLSPGGGHMIKDHKDSTGLVFDIKELELELEEEESKKSPSEAELDALRAVKSHLLYVRNNGFYRSMVQTLHASDLIYKLSVPKDTFSRFSNFADYDGSKKKLVGIVDAPALRSGAISQALKEKGPQSASLEKNIYEVEKDEAIRSYSNPFTGHFYIGPDNRNALRDQIYFTTVGNLIAVALDHITGHKSFTIGRLGKIKDLKEIHMAAMGESPTELETAQAAAITAGSTVRTEDSKDTGSIDPGTYDATPSGINITPTKAKLLKRFRVILGSMAYENAKGQTKTINIAHLPVSMQMFRQFMIKRVISNQRAFYSFQDFARDILTDIVFDSLQRICFGGITRNTQLRTGISLFTGQGTGDGGSEEPITSAPLKIYKQTRTDNTGDYKSLVTSAAKASDPIFKKITSAKALDFNYLMFSAFSVAMMNKNLHGDEKEDSDNGIAHFRYGSTSGLLKSVSFSKTPIDYLAEERYVREGTDNLLNQLAGRYEMQMSLVGNNMFIPGQYVYFDPVALGIGKSMTNDGSSRSLANLMGLGGYHIITEVGCSITPGKFETTIKGLWETGGTPKPVTKSEVT